MKKALITGASGGIGLELAKQLSAIGYSITLVARNEIHLKEVVRELAGKDHQYLAADLGRIDDVKKTAAHLTTNHYDVLINNAGVGIYKTFTESDLDAQLQMMKLNCDALLILSHAYLQHAVKGDSLINIGSTLGSTSFATAAAYAGTKGFVIKFTESLWEENRKKGIFVSVFSPGVTKSNFHKAAGGDESEWPEAIQQTSAQVATELLKGLKERRQPHIVSGFMNRSMLSFYRLLPRKSIVKIMGSFAPKKTIGNVSI